MMYHQAKSVILIFIVNLIIKFYSYKEFIFSNCYINKLTINFDLFNQDYRLNNKMIVDHLIQYCKNCSKTIQQQVVIQTIFYKLKIYHLFCNESSCIYFCCKNILYPFLIWNNYLFNILNLSSENINHSRMLQKQGI